MIKKIAYKGEKNMETCRSIYELNNRLMGAMIVGESDYDDVDEIRLSACISQLIVYYGVRDFYCDNLSPFTIEAAKIIRQLKKQYSMIKYHLVLPPWRIRSDGNYLSDSVIVVDKWASNIDAVPATYQYMVEYCGYGVFNVLHNDSEAHYTKMYAEDKYLKTFEIY